jgi:acetolactate synthase-1/2/3 large subunit
MATPPDAPDRAPMNGAESLVRTLVAGGVDHCFANPGTSEMHFVAALDRVEGMRCVLFLFEGGATGAADGYARMAEKPACTLLISARGSGTGSRTCTTPRRARSPVVNIVGEHATYHVAHDAPLTSDIEGIARPVSAWVRTSPDSRRVAQDGAEAIAAASRPPGGVATLILRPTPPGGGGSGRDPAPRPGPRCRAGRPRAGRRGRPALGRAGHALPGRPGAPGGRPGDRRPDCRPHGRPDAGAGLQCPHGARRGPRIRRTPALPGGCGLAALPGSATSS